MVDAVNGDLIPQFAKETVQNGLDCIEVGFSHEPIKAIAASLTLCGQVKPVQGSEMMLSSGRQ
jgi:hypothetical protein